MSDSSTFAAYQVINIVARQNDPVAEAANSAGSPRGSNVGTKGPKKVAPGSQEGARSPVLQVITSPGSPLPAL